MPALTEDEKRLTRHVARLRNCRRCPRMHPPPVSGGPVVSNVILVGQAPGVREPVAGKPFAWIAGKTLFRWFEEGKLKPRVSHRLDLKDVAQAMNLLSQRKSSGKVLLTTGRN